MPSRPLSWARMGDLKFTLDKGYYAQPTHVFNLPAGWSCPFADSCLTKADRGTGKLVVRPDRNKDGTPNHREDAYVCYAARSERFPTARESRWHNFEVTRDHVKTGGVFLIPPAATHVRVHGSGDFYSQAYFDLWLETARAYPNVKFWAFTKSIAFWVNRLGSIPDNFALTASRGSKQEALIDEHGLKTAEVFYRLEDVPEDMMIDLNDWEAQHSERPSFALLENMANKGHAEWDEVHEHNRRAAKIAGLSWPNL